MLKTAVVFAAGAVTGVALVRPDMLEQFIDSGRTITDRLIERLDSDYAFDHFLESSETSSEMGQDEILEIWPGTTSPEPETGQDEMSASWPSTESADHISQSDNQMSEQSNQAIESNYLANKWNTQQR